jgi:protein-disulfide isomerase
MAPEQKLTKKQRKELRKIEWQKKAKIDQRNQQIKKYSIWAGAIAVIGLVILGLVMLVNSPAPSSSEKANVAPITSRDITNGESKAKVTLIEYADFQCPACAAYHPIVNQVLEQFKGKIFYAYRIFPLTNIHKNAIISAQAAYAAKKQGKFFEMSDMLFNKQKEWESLQDPTETFTGYAKVLKLDSDKFKNDMSSSEAKKYVSDSEQEALSEGINSTPTFILNGNKITNPQNYDAFKKLIENELNKK